MSSLGRKVLVKRVLKNLGRIALVLPVMACAEIQVGVELAKRANRAVDARVIKADPLPPQAQQSAAVSPYLAPAPEVFEATGIAQWDGKRTLQGVWVAHPLATTARRVRIFNTENGQAVDGALFKRDAALTGASVLISSEAAQRLGIEAGGRAELRIVAVTPVSQPQPEPQPSAADVAEDQTDKPVSSPAATATTEQATSPQPATAEAKKPAGGAVIAAVTPRPRPAAPEKPEEPKAEQKPAEPKAVEKPKATEEPKVAEKPKAKEEPLQVAKAEPAKKAEPPTAAPAEPKPATATQEQPKDTADADGGTTFKWDKPPSTDAATSGSKKEAEPAKKAAAAKPKTKAKKAVASKLRLPFVQAGIFSVKANANRVIRRLKARGFPAVGKTFKSKGRTLTRVLAGPFNSTAQRNRARAALRKMGMRDAVPVRR